MGTPCVLILKGKTMSNSTKILHDLETKALKIALNAYCSDWEAFDDPREALQSIAEGFGIVSIWAPLEDLPADQLCESIECLAADIYNALIESA
jgi:hypothetical protein